MRGFRVYDKALKRYVTSEWEWLITTDGELVYKESYDLISTDDCVVEWATGLTDDKGNKIFDGDILKIQTDVPCKKFNDLGYCNGIDVVKREDYAVVQNNPNTGGYKLKVYHKGKYKRIAKFDYNHLWAYDAEIIGNIHEDAELLEVEE